MAKETPAICPLPITFPDPSSIKSGSFVYKSMAISLRSRKSGNLIGGSHSVWGLNKGVIIYE